MTQRHRHSRSRKQQSFFAAPVMMCSVFALLSMPTPSYATENAEPASSLLDIAQKFMKKVQPKLEQTQKKYEKIEKREAEIKDPFKDYQEDENFFFLLTKNRVILNDGIYTTLKNKKLYMSFSEFVSGLDFPIQIDYGKKTASGWFVREDLKFLLDLNTNQAIAGEREVVLNENDYILDEETSDILLTSDALARIFNFELKVDPKKLTIEIISPTQLPVEEKIARQKRKEKTVSSRDKPVLPEVFQEYEAISEPFVDVQLAQTYAQSQGADAYSQSRYSVIAANDLAYGGFKTYVAGTDDDPVDQVRLTWARDAKEGEDLFLDVDKLQLGDVTPTNMNLFNGVGQEFGVRIDDTKKGDDIDDTTDTTRFEGDIQPGWDVEIYNNGIFVGGQTAGPDGRYVFEDVSLNFGDNNFRLVFYGPQGQIEEQTKTVVRRGIRLDPGEDTYSLSLTNRGEITYDASDDSGIPDRGTPNLMGNYEIGLSDNFSASLGGRLHENAGEENAQGYVGLTGFFDSGIYEVNVGAESQGGAGIEATALTAVAGQSLRLNHQTNTNDFDTPYPLSDNIVMQNDAILQGPLIEDVTYNTSLSHFMLDSGSNSYDYNATVGTHYGRGNVNVGYNLLYDERNPTGDMEQFFNVNTTYNFAPFFLRGRVNYNIAPEAELRSLFGSVSTNFTPELGGQFDVEHFTNSSLTEFRGRLNYKTEHFIVSPDVTYDTDETIRALVSMRFGVGRDPYTGKTIMSRENLTSLGGVSSNVFLDEDGDGIWDSYEQPIEGAEVHAIQASRKKKTDADGRVFMPNLYDGTKTDVVLERKSLSDPYWVSANEGNSIRPRSGKITQMNFPVVMTGEIDGVVNLLMNNGGIRPARNMPIHLIDSEGKVAQTVQTAHDGFYVMSNIHPGSYKMVLDETELNARGLLPVESRGFIVTPKGDMFYDKSFLTVDKEILPERLSVFADANTDKGVVIELGRYNSKMMMGLKLLSLKRNYGALIAGMTSFSGILKQDKNLADNKYALQLGPVKDLAQATNICNILKQFGETCTMKSVQYDMQKVSANTVIEGSI